jgi:NAD(P)-dependent dehydrogenase (short-subunit alcohol dehydrogenase family)
MLTIFSRRQLLGTPDDIAAMVALLVSPRGSFVTGTTIQADGGSRSSPL